MSDVNITIDIDADTSGIDRTRARLRMLARDADDASDAFDRHSASLRDLSDSQDDFDSGSRRNQRNFNNTGKKAKGLTGFLRKLAKFGFLYLGIEAAAALVIIGSAGVLFKSGQLLAKGYEMALSGVAYAMTAIVAAAAAALAAMRQFQAVQFAPSFSKGAINTDDPMRAASAGMKMFIDDQQMAVIGTKGLTSAFKTLNDQQQITGKTTAVFRQLSNYTAGMGGDMEKGSQAMAKFLAQFQKDKRMTEAVKEAGKELGPNFKKILDEANKLGLNTYEKFSKAAMDGELGKTFQLYSGQLDALNSTVIGRFKQGFTELKSILVEVGEPLLGPLTKQIPRVINIIKGMVLTIRHNVEEIGKGSLLEGLVSGFEKIAIVITRIVTRDLGRAGSSLDKIVNGWRSMMGFFERVSDYMRTLVPAAEALGRILMDILRAFGGSLGDRINTLSEQLVKNEEKFNSFTKGLQNFMEGFSKIGSVFVKAFVQAMPLMMVLLTIIGKLLGFFAKMLEILMSIGGAIDAVLNPLLSLVDKLTFGFISMRDVAKTLTAAIIALGLAMLFSKKVRGGVGGFLGLDIGDAKAIKKGKFARKGANLLGRGAKAGGRIGKKGVMAGGRAALSGLSSLGGGSVAAGGALVAGSAAGGFFSGGYVSDKLFNANTKMSRAGGTLAGAGTGAAVGAAIGSIIPGAGTAAGAIIGGIAGAIGGYLNAGKERRKYDNIAKDVLKEYSSSLNDAVEKGDTKALEKAAETANAAYLDLLNGGKYGLQTYNAKLKELEKLNKQASNAFQNFSTFETIFGDPDKLNAELKKQGYAADAVKNQVIDIFAVMRQGGHDVEATWSAVMGEFNQKLLSARLAMFQLPLQTIEMQEKVNAAQQRVLDGDTSDKSIISFLQDAFEYSMNLAQGDVTAATVHFEKTIKAVSGPNGSMNKVAGKLKEQTDKLQLFDPQVFAKQLIMTGQTEVQGRATAALTGGDANLATLEINRRIQSGGAAEADRINELLRLGTSGALTGNQVSAAFSGDSEVFTNILNSGRRTEIERNNARRRSGETGVAAPNGRQVNVGGVTVSVAGFISDPKVAAKIAQLVAAEIAKRESRAGNR